MSIQWVPARVCAFVALVACRAAPAPPQHAPTATARTTCCPIVELRQYTLHPGRRDVLIELFDRAFIESQEAEGMAILGQFRDLDRPDRFVWLRGFDDMPGRARSLSAFYGGPAWKAHSREANATMVDSENVLLLRPARPGSEFSLGERHRPSAPASGPPAPRLVIATIYYFDRIVPDDAVAAFERDIAPLWTAAGASIVAQLVSETSANTFPRLPVREDDRVFAVFCAFATEDDYAHYLDALAHSERSRDAANDFARQLVRPPETLRLSPTSRSLL